MHQSPIHLDHSVLQTRGDSQLHSLYIQDHLRKLYIQDEQHNAYTYINLKGLVGIVDIVGVQ